MKIYVFGNPLVREDSLPLKILPELKKSFPQITFEVVDPNENFPQDNEKDLIILDTVKGIKKPGIFNLKDLEYFRKSPNSPHDYDLRLHLLLLKKLNKVNSVIIIGIASRHDRDKMHKSESFINSIKEIISTLL